MSTRDRQTIYEEIQSILLQWFRDNRRDLPWRRTYDPYHVWISEIMLQQTQMERGTEYFLKWIERFPDVFAVAESSEQEILRYWQGLGYYARARNLHKTAKLLVQNMEGEVPSDYSQLLKLPGIGPYTAAAIASIAGNHPCPAVDANVSRVYARLFNISTPLQSSSTKKKIADLAAGLLPNDKPRQYNQALMDFGSLVCSSKNPKCSSCPLNHLCDSFSKSLVSQRPVSGAKLKTKHLNWVAYVVLCEHKVFIYQRPANGVWGGLWEFPILERTGRMEPWEKDLEKLKSEGIQIQKVEPVVEVQHQYTNHKIHLSSVLCVVSAHSVSDTLWGKKGRWVFPKNLNRYGFPAGSRKILDYITLYRPEIFERRIPPN